MKIFPEKKKLCSIKHRHIVTRVFLLTLAAKKKKKKIKAKNISDNIVLV